MKNRTRKKVGTNTKSNQRRTLIRPWADEFPAELFEQPRITLRPGDPEPGTPDDQALLSPGQTIEGAAKSFTEECAGGDRFANNCAHFLSNAFLLAGFNELKPAGGHPCIKARCIRGFRRPIRARNMWCWFDSKAVRKGRDVRRNTGFWAVFQVNSYWGGHVVIIDSDKWKYYGTGWYGDWSQYSYQW
jgi:hypothetical protein